MFKGEPTPDDQKERLKSRILPEYHPAPEYKDQLDVIKAKLELLKEEKRKLDTRPDTQKLIAQTCDDIRDFLLEKNEQYGDSAINPVRIFSKSSPHEQLLVRMDDKLSRLARGDDRLESDDDVLDDLIGYLILYKVAKAKEASDADA